VAVDVTGRHILLIEDNPGDARLIREMLAEAPVFEHQLTWTDTLARGLASLSEGNVDVVLLDLSLPDSHGLVTFSAVRDHAPVVPIVVLSGSIDEETALAAVHEGAQDYLVKGRVDGYLLARSLRYAIERKQNEETQKLLYRQASEAIRLRDTVLSSVSHDLRNPLMAIRVIAETVRLQVAQEPNRDLEAIDEGLERIERNTQRMASQIDELLDVAHLQSGEKVHLTVRSADLVALTCETIHDYQQRTRRHRISFEPPGVPVVGRWDRARLERVLGNLLSNAIKYSLAGGDIVVRIGVEERDQTRWATLAVQDAGVGIPAADLPRVFSWFYRGENVASEVAGAGIGLAGSRQIVELHGGTIHVESQEGVGSTFTVRLPLLAEDDISPRFDEGLPT
jgi:signal transduction histidine kinase